MVDFVFFENRRDMKRVAIVNLSHANYVIQSTSPIEEHTNSGGTRAFAARGKRLFCRPTPSDIVTITMMGICVKLWIV